MDKFHNTINKFIGLKTIERISKCLVFNLMLYYRNKNNYTIALFCKSSIK